MQKKLIALAVASAVAAPMALADVTVYGKADFSYNYIENDNATGGFEDDSQGVSSNSSRIGFKGSEDLGGGLKANFLVETQWAQNGGGAALNARNVWAGLSGGWGEVRLGRHDTPFKIAGRKTDFYESEQLGENRVLFNSQDRTFDNRVNDVVAYFTPNFNGFQGVVAYIPEEHIDDGDGWSLAGFYSNGPLFLTVAYEQLNEGFLGGVAPPPNAEEQTAWRFGGKYSFGDFTVSGLYQIADDTGGVDGDDLDVWWLGGKYAFGNNDLMATYGQYDMDDNGALTDREADMWTLGLNHNFSKRTMLYARYASVDNDSGANATFSGGNGLDNGDGASRLGAAVGEDSDGFSVGMRHKF